jgi:sugar lactone lactonase YvrE
MIKNLIFLLFLFFNASISAQSLNELYASSLKAHKYKSYATFLSFSRTLDSLRPSHPIYAYNVAAGYALNQQPAKAIDALEKYILMNSAVEFEKDSDFVSLRGTADFNRLISLKTELSKVIFGSSKFVTLTEKDLHPEGLFYLKKSKKWLATSIRKGKIVSFDKNGKCADWLKADGMFSVFGIKAGSDEKYLWATTSAFEEMEGYSANMKGKAEVLKINIKSKKIEQRFSVLGNHIFGDLVVARNGVVYISDTEKPIIYKIQNGQITEWLSLKGEAFSLQGITLNSDESKIYVADYLSGVLSISINDPSKRQWLDFPKGATVKGIDGLAWHDNSLIAIHNGAKPIRVMRYLLNDNGDQIKSYKVIDNNRPEFNEPALCTINDGTLFFFANCPWNAYDKRHNLDESKYTNPMLYAFKLD